MKLIKQIKDKANNIRDSWSAKECKTDFTLEEILIMYANKMDDIIGDTFPNKEERRLFQDLGRVDKFRDYLRVSANKYFQRYYQASTDKERDTIRGAISNTVYLQGKMITVDKPDNTDTKIKGLRYGKKVD